VQCVMVCMRCNDRGYRTGCKKKKLYIYNDIIIMVCMRCDDRGYRTGYLIDERDEHCARAALCAEYGVLNWGTLAAAIRHLI